MLRAQGEIPATLSGATQLGEHLAEDLLSQGAAKLIAQERGARPEAP
jgi:hypothetical protein